MGVMNKMREQTALVLWLLVLAFGGLWVLQDSGFFDAVAGRRPMGVGSVNGVPIDPEQYSNAVQQRVSAYEQQGMELTPAMRTRIENEVFDELVNNVLREQEMDRLGVSVSDAEVDQLFRGANPDPFVVQLFGDGRGGVDRAALEEFIAAPENQPMVLQLEDAVRRNRRQAKLDALVTAAARVSEAEVEAEYVRRNRRATIEYVALRYADAPASAVRIDDAALRAYYNEHRDEFERPRTASVEYVVFPKTPTADDSTRVRDELQGLRAGFASAADPAAFSGENYGTGEVAYAPATGLDPTLATAIYRDLTVNRIVGPVFAGGEVVLARITGVRPAEGGEAVHARHILFATDQRAQAEQVKARIQSGQLAFAAAARQYSTDESNKNQGGELGWFARGRMVAPFEEAVFAGQPGTIIGPVETQFGWHLVEVLGRTNQDAELARISRPLVGTYDRLIEQADDLRFLAEAEGRGFADEARRRRYDLQTAEVDLDEGVVPNVSAGSDAIAWLRNAREGAISEAYDTGDAYVVFQVTDTQAAGTRPFDEVKAEIEPRVRLEQQREAQAARMRTALQQAGGDLTRLSRALGTAVARASEIQEGNPVIEGIGPAPQLVGAAFGTPTGRTSGVIEGETAAYVVRPVSVVGGDLSGLTAADRTTIREQLLQRKRGMLRQTWMQALRDAADIEDHRDDMATGG